MADLDSSQHGRAEYVHPSINFVGNEHLRFLYKAMYPSSVTFINNYTILGWFFHFSNLKHQADIPPKNILLMKIIRFNLNGNHLLTTIVPSLPCCWWKFNMSSKGKSQMTSLLRTKKGSSLSVKSSRAKAKGPARKKQLDSYSITFVERCTVRMWKWLPTSA